MKKVFISQPMRGLSDAEIKEERKVIKQAIIKEYGDVEFIDSYFEGAPADARPLWFLGKSFELLSTADMAFFAYGWEKARGCVMEHTACLSYGIEIIRD
jgi:hypothetical protein|nr:MAG TPA: protein of unknown function (DUF4406) [Caudoviricetes sp.]